MRKRQQSRPVERDAPCPRASAARPPWPNGQGDKATRRQGEPGEAGPTCWRDAKSSRPKTRGNIAAVITPCLAATTISGGMPVALDKPLSTVCVRVCPILEHTPPAHATMLATREHCCCCCWVGTHGLTTPPQDSRLTLQPCNALGATVVVKCESGRAMW